ncbi:MAG: DUF2685 domain-containing protein [Bacteroidales bacterium]
MSELKEDCKCVVCKNPIPTATGFVTESGRVCGVICAQYLAERNKSGLNEADDLNEVQMLL